MRPGKHRTLNKESEADAMIGKAEKLKAGTHPQYKSRQLSFRTMYRELSGLILSMGELTKQLRQDRAMHVHLRFENISVNMRWLVAAWAIVLGVGIVLAQAVQGVTDSEIVIGSLQDLSGPVASLGVPSRDGMILAVEEINAAGGIHGRKLRLVVEDSGFDPKKAVLATQKMLAQDKVFAIIATLGTAVTRASMPLALERGVPYLFPISSIDIGYVPPSPLKFGFYASNAPHMRALVVYAHNNLGKRRFGILYQDDEIGLGAMRAAEEQLKVHGLMLVERMSFKRGDTNFSPQIARLKAASVDVVLLGTIIRETSRAAIEVKTQGWQVDMMVPWGTTQTVINLGVQAVEGLYGATQFAGAPQELTPAFKAINDRFKARFGREVTDGVNYGYASTMLFAEGAKNAGRGLTAQSLSQGLEKVKNFTTVFGAPSVSYAPDDHAPPRQAFIMQVRGGKWAPISGPVTY